MDRFKKQILYILLFMLLFPFLIIIIWSFANNWSWPYLLPNRFGIRAWRYFFDANIKSFSILIKSIIISFFVMILVFLLTIPAAKALAFNDFKGKNFFEFLFFLPLVVPIASIAMGIHIQFIKIGLSGNYIGIILIQAFPCIPYAFAILKSGFEILNAEIENQAKLLGANSFQIYRYILLPLLFPSMIASGTIVFVVSFSQYFLTVLIGSGKIITFPMIMMPFIQSGDRTTGSVFSIIFVSVSLFLILISKKILKTYYIKKFGADYNGNDKIRKNI